MSAELATDTEFVWRKWDGTPHWRFLMAYLGSDEHGDWFGQRVGGEASRPGADIVLTENQVALVPRYGAWIATFHEPPQVDRILTYVDVAAQVEYDPAAGVVSAIDMDLDVLKTDDERATWVDDEDEFEERTVSMAYPRTVVGEVTRTAAELVAVMRSSAPPFDGCHGQWLQKLADLG
jgi:hypothetical protein